jgi:hypothetical protein
MEHAEDKSDLEDFIRTTQALDDFNIFPHRIASSKFPRLHLVDLKKVRKYILLRIRRTALL